MIAPGRFWVIRYPSNQGEVVGRFDTEGETLIPDNVAEYDGFVVQQVADRSKLVEKSVDQSGLSEGEKELLGTVFPVIGR